MYVNIYIPTSPLGEVVCTYITFVNDRTSWASELGRNPYRDDCVYYD